MNGDDSHEVTPWEFHGSWNIQGKPVEFVYFREEGVHLKIY